MPQYKLSVLKRTLIPATDVWELSFTDPAYKYVTKDGENAFELLREQANTLKNSGEYGYKVDDSRLSHSKRLTTLEKRWLLICMG